MRRINKSECIDTPHWDEKTGWPTRGILEELGLKHVANELESKGKLGAS